MNIKILKRQRVTFALFLWKDKEEWAAEPTCHGKSTHQQTNVSATNYYGLTALFCAATIFGFPGSPYSNQQY